MLSISAIGATGCRAGTTTSANGSTPPPSRAAPDDIGNVPALDLRVGGNDQQRYFLIGAASQPPKEKVGLLLVLPGGDGSAEFHPFVKRIYANALPENYLVAQLVAVPSDDLRQIVWPTARTPHAKQKFSTEDFIKAVVADVKAKYPIDDKKVFTLSWSSGGPAAYAASLAKDSPVAGSFIAMSIFPARNLGPLESAKGHKYYLLHSPQDQVCKYVFTSMAAAQLGNAGGVVKVADYQGGHGWHGDIYGNIRAGVRWLETNDDPAETASPATKPAE